MRTIENEDEIGVAPYQIVEQIVTKIRIKCNVKFLTFEYRPGFEENVYRKPKYIIRISAYNYKTPECLANFDR